MSTLQAELFAFPVEQKVPPPSLSRRPRRPRPIDSIEVSEEVNEWMPTTSRLTPDEKIFRARKALASHDRDIAQSVDTLANLTEAWVRTEGKAGAKVSPSTIRSYKTGIKRLLTDLRGRELQDLKPDVAKSWVKRMQEGGNGARPGTLQARLSAVRALYSSLRWIGATSANPFEHIRVEEDVLPAWQKRQPYTSDEMVKILALDLDPADRVLVLLGSHAALRVGECCNLGWRDVDLDRRELTVKHGNGKGQAKRHVPLGPTLIKALQDLQVARPLLKQGPVLNMTPITAWRRMKAICEWAGVKPRDVESLRHYAAMRVYKRLDDILYVAELLGLKSLDAALVYVTRDDNKLREAVAEW